MLHSRLVPLIAFAALSASALAGCAAVTGPRQHTDASEYNSKKELVERWGKSAPWLPDDTSSISVRESPLGDPAVLLAVSTGELDPALCTATARKSEPVFTMVGSPDAYPDKVFACGDWAVVASEGGWFGWTPNHPEEKAASPAPATS